eukprot:1157110-Pelagomonas_calceolata.AAC.8
MRRKMRTTRRMRSTGRNSTLLSLRLVMSTLTMDSKVMTASKMFQPFLQYVLKPMAISLCAQNAPNLSNKITQALESMHTDTSWNHRGRAQRAMCLQPAASNFLPLLVKAQEHRSMP